MADLRIGPCVAFVSKFWAVEDVITRSRTASGHVDGAGTGHWRRDLIVVAVAEPVEHGCPGLPVYKGSRPC